jgi:hypothetical protein
MMPEQGKLQARCKSDVLLVFSKNQPELECEETGLERRSMHSGK